MWDGPVALNSRTSNTRDPVLAMSLCNSFNPNLSFYVFIDFTPWQLPQTSLTQRAAAHGELPLNRVATKSTLGTGVWLHDAASVALHLFPLQGHLWQFSDAAPG